MRLAQRQIWRLVADRAHGLGQAVGRQRSSEGQPGHDGDDANEEARHQRLAAGIRPRLTEHGGRSVVEPAAVSPFAAWESFYVIVGSSAAALTGLQFVVVVLGAEVNALTDVSGTRAFGTP